MLWFLYFPEHAVFLLERLPLLWHCVAVAVGEVHGRDDHLDLPQLADAARHILVLHSQVFISNTRQRHFVHVLRVLSIVIQEVLFFGFIRTKFTNDIVTLASTFSFFLGYEEVRSFVKWAFLGKQHANSLFSTLL